MTTKPVGRNCLHDLGMHSRIPLKFTLDFILTNAASVIFASIPNSVFANPFLYEIYLRGAVSKIVRSQSSLLSTYYSRSNVTES